jgi:dihydropteroate synthase
VTDSLLLGSASLEFGGVTHVMGVINLSPESRNRHTFARDSDAAVEMAIRYGKAGATLIDVGAQSSHFENPTLTEDGEIARLIPTVGKLAAEGFLVSVDTWKPQVAEAALLEGAVMVNDTGGLGLKMREVIARHRAAVVYVYVEGASPHQVGEVDIHDGKAAHIAAEMAKTLALVPGGNLERVVLDPGIAVNYRGDYDAYTRLQLEVIRESAALKALGRPLLIPIPRKREDHWVAAYITMALEYQADLIRVHDVEMACDLVRLFGRSPAEVTGHR